MYTATAVVLAQLAVMCVQLLTDVVNTVSLLLLLLLLITGHMMWETECITGYLKTARCRAQLL
jgi:hypothetical protein